MSRKRREASKRHLEALKDLQRRAELHDCDFLQILQEDVSLETGGELFCPNGGNSSLVLVGFLADNGEWVGTRVRRSDRKGFC